MKAHYRDAAKQNASMVRILPDDTRTETPATSGGNKADASSSAVPRDS